MQYKFVMFQTQAVSPITFRFHISVQAKIIRILLMLGKIWKDRQKCAVCNWWSAGCYLMRRCYLNEKNLMHGRVTATISKFSPQIFETYYRMKFCKKLVILNHCQIITNYFSYRLKPVVFFSLRLFISLFFKKNSYKLILFKLNRIHYIRCQDSNFKVNINIQYNF